MNIRIQHYGMIFRIIFLQISILMHVVNIGEVSKQIIVEWSDYHDASSTRVQLVPKSDIEQSQLLFIELVWQLVDLHII